MAEPTLIVETQSLSRLARPGQIDGRRNRHCQGPMTVLTRSLGGPVNGCQRSRPGQPRLEHQIVAEHIDRGGLPRSGGMARHADHGRSIAGAERAALEYVLHDSAGGR